MATNCALAREAASRLLRVQLDKLRKQIDGVCKEDPDAIHDMRVASRRLRAILKAHPDVTTSKEPRKQFQQLVRAITKGLGKARELDVSLQRLNSHRDEFHDAPRHAVIYVAKRLRALRQAESDAVQRCADLTQSHEFAQATIAFFEQLCPAKTCYVQNASDALIEQVNALHEVYGLWRVQPYEDLLHAIRIRFKKLRYACEAYAPLYGRPMSKQIKSLKKAQEALGDWNDYRVLRDYAAGFRPDASPRAAEGLPQLIAALDGFTTEKLEVFETNSGEYFTHKNRARSLKFFAKPELPCCKDKSLDPGQLDTLYGIPDPAAD